MNKIIIDTYCNKFCFKSKRIVNSNGNERLQGISSKDKLKLLKMQKTDILIIGICFASLFMII